MRVSQTGGTEEMSPGFRSAPAEAPGGVAAAGFDRNHEPGDGRPEGPGARLGRSSARADRAAGHRGPAPLRGGSQGRRARRNSAEGSHGLPADRELRRHRRPAHGRARRHGRVDRLPVRARASTRRRCSRRCSTTSAAAASSSRRCSTAHAGSSSTCPTRTCSSRASSPTTASPRSPTSCRSRRRRTTHNVVRRAKTVRGEVRFRMVLPAALRLRARHPHRRAHARRRALHLDGKPTAIALRLRTSVPAAHRGRRRRVAEFTLRADESALVRPRAGRSPGRSRRAARRDYVAEAFKDTVELLARWIGRSDVPGPLARDGEPLGAHAEAAHLAALRLDRRRADLRPARADRRRAQLGLSLHAGSATRRSRSTALMRLGFTDEAAAFMRWVEARCQRARARRLAADHVRHRRPPRAPRGDPRSPRGLPGLGAGAHRQRGAHPAPARHLRRADGRDLPLRQVRRADLVRPVEQRRRASSTGCARTGASPTRASGRCAAAARSSSTRA